MLQQSSIRRGKFSFNTISFKRLWKEISLLCKCLWQHEGIISYNNQTHNNMWCSTQYHVQQFVKLSYKKQQCITVIAISYLIIHKTRLCLRSVFWDMTWHWLVNSYWCFGGAHRNASVMQWLKQTASFTFGLAHCITPPLTLLYYPRHPHLYITLIFSSVATLLGLPRPCRWRQQVNLECR